MLPVVAIFLFIRSKKKKEISEPIVDSTPNTDSLDVSAKLALAKARYQQFRRRGFLDAMAKHESAKFTNTLSTQHNNIFSMGWPFKRPKVNEGKTQKLYEGQQMSVYRNREQAINDLYLWMLYNNVPYHGQNLYTMVDSLKAKGYFTQNKSVYMAGVKKHFDDVEQGRETKVI